ncbi:AmiS/UreI family transporter [Leucobacter aridicollis]|uniref:AmiS/UreI family transporter n=1 Tax=Leucobacter aridicollis TaxID=283878 RepID=UPI002169450F|nr:AmiS/UreI family transporter [Leucobacter aridicollis]MCS3427213.1 apolipoprotein N-acyltransferase [Leucobacter aridicollis]
MMTDVGLMYVGAVLIVNGVVLLGRITGRAAAPLNLMVGALQLIVSLALMLDPAAPSGSAFTAGGLLLFAFTYLWVGVNDLAGLPANGFGWFSCFVAVAAAGMAVYCGLTASWVGLVQWSLWAVLWWSFFVLLALERSRWQRFTGGLAVLAGVATTGVPGAAALAGVWTESAQLAVGLGVLCGVGTGCLLLLTRSDPHPDAASVPSPATTDGVVPAAGEAAGAMPTSVGR